MKKLSVFLIFILIALVIVPACWKDENASWSRQLPSADINELSFTEIWQTVVTGSRVEDSTARLKYLTLIVEPDKQIFLHILFEGRDSKGHLRFYNASGLGHDFSITGYSYETQGIISDHHPMDIFSELDKMSLQKMVEIKNGTYGISLAINFIWGSLINNKHFGLYELKEGLLVPLKEVIFDNQTSMAEICLFDEVVGTQLWFLPQDLARAESVEYLDSL